MKLLNIKINCKFKKGNVEYVFELLNANEILYETRFTEQ